MSISPCTPSPRCFSPPRLQDMYTGRPRWMATFRLGEAGYSVLPRGSVTRRTAALIFTSIPKYFARICSIPSDRARLERLRAVTMAVGEENG